MKAQLEAAIGPAAEVSGIGDSAYTYGDEVCHVLKGKYLLGISVLGPPGGVARDRLVTVCRSAARSALGVARPLSNPSRSRRHS